MERKVFGTDIDVPIGEGSIDVLAKFRNLATFLPQAESLTIYLLGRLDQKDAFRIRIKGIYKD